MAAPQVAAPQILRARLITFAFSHFCEKARFALDLSPLKYTEEPHAPGAHRLAVKDLVENPRKTHLPVLVLEKEQQVSVPDEAIKPIIFQCSTMIMQYLHATYPEELGHWFPPTQEKEILEFIKQLNELGVHSRIWAYSYLLDDTAACKKVFCNGVPFMERVTMPIAFPKIKAAMIKGIGISKESGIESLAVCQKLFDDVDNRLSDGGRYIFGGTRMTAADIAFAGIAYPIVFPNEMNGIAFSYEACPPDMQVIIDRLRHTSAGKHVIRMYHEERYPIKDDNDNKGIAVHLQNQDAGGCNIS